MKNLYQVGDYVMWCGESATVEEVRPTNGDDTYYFIRFVRGGHTMAPECELEPIESN